MGDASLVQALWMTIAVFFTLAIFSFLYKDNPFYKIAEHIVVGVSNGYWLILLFRDTFYPLWYQPLQTLLTRPFGGSLAEWDSLLFIVVATVFSIFMLFRFFGGKPVLFSRWSMALVLGISAGVLIPLSVQTYFYGQFKGNMLSTTALLVSFGEQQYQGVFDNLLILFGSLSGLAYFFFSKEHKGTFGGFAKIGTWFLMVGFGATFGYTVMARLSLLIGRVEFLSGWMETLKRVFL